MYYTISVQPVATCRQSRCLHKPAIVTVTSFWLWRLAPKALAAPVLIMTSFWLWRHSLLSWPRPPLQTSVRTLRTDTFSYRSPVGSHVTLNEWWYLGNELERRLLEVANRKWWPIKWQHFGWYSVTFKIISPYSCLRVYCLSLPTVLLSRFIFLPS